jgi:hypothetical protein
MPDGATRISRERLGLTEDGEVVPADHATAAQLLVGAGCEIDAAVVASLGIEDKMLTQAEIEERIARRNGLRIAGEEPRRGRRRE